MIEPRPSFARRAWWVLEELATALGREATRVSGDADLTYSERRPAGGAWIPMQREAQAFFEGTEAFPTRRAVYRERGLTLLFPPTKPDAAIPGDVIASAFYLLARWDEHAQPARDRFGRLPLAASAFANIEGLALDDPVVEGYLAALRAALGIAPPTSWSVPLTHDIDRVRRRTLRGLAGIARRRGPGGLGRALIGPDPWNNLIDLLATTATRGTAATVFLIGRNAHPLDGTPRRTYERERAAMARTVRAAGGEVGLHAAFASSEDPDALAAELEGLRAETGPVRGVRFHYLRFRYHETVAWLERAGAEYDASLGFSEAPGFAAGIARPFRPYIIAEERPARLRLVPLAVMDTSLHGHLGLGAEAAVERAWEVLDVVRRVGGEAALLWHNTFLADDRAPAYDEAWRHLVAKLGASGAAIGPISPERAPSGAALPGLRALHLSTVHRPRDVRIFHKEARALSEAGASARTVAAPNPIPRARRVVAGWRLARLARASDADVYHLHDPELLPVGLWLRRKTGAAVVYDVHEYLGSTSRTKRWIPAPLRGPVSKIAERGERVLASRLDGVVAVNPDLAARFAASGARQLATVANSPWGADFPSPQPPGDEPLIVYVGGLGPLRGLPLMKDAFARLRTPGARLVLAGPGEPGELPPGASAVGRVDHSEVASLLAAARVAWVPLQRHGNYDRAVPTKLIEAMASGRPVVASDLGTMGAVVRRAGCGLLVEPGDAEAHARALDRLLSDPAEARRLGAAGRRVIERDGLTFEAEAARLTDLYSRLVP